MVVEFDFRLVRVAALGYIRQNLERGCGRDS